MCSVSACVYLNRYLCAAYKPVCDYIAICPQSVSLRVLAGHLCIVCLYTLEIPYIYNHVIYKQIILLLPL